MELPVCWLFFDAVLLPGYPYLLDIAMIQITLGTARLMGTSYRAMRA